MVGTATLSFTLAVMTPGAGASVAAPSPLAQGTLRYFGRAVAGADVVALVYPNQWEMASGRTGDTFQLRAIGVTRTNSAGAFRIDANPASLPPTYVGSDGRVDVELVAADSTREIRWNFTAMPSVPVGARRASENAGWVLAAASLPGRETAANLLLDLGKSTAWDRGNDPASWVNAQGRPVGASRRDAAAAVLSERRTPQVDAAIAVVAHARRAAAQLGGKAPVEAAAIPCTAQWGKWHKNRPEHFLNVYGWSGAKGTVTEAVGVDHTLGVGISTDGFAHIKASGSSTISLQASDSQDRVADSSVWNRVNYRDVIANCAPEQRRPINHYDILSNDWSRVSHVNHKASCGIKLRGATFTTTRAKNVTYSGGVDIGPANVSAQSGYGHGMELKFTFTRKSRLCGNSKNGLLSSSSLDARKP
jgi:hypothetical protein